MLKRPTQIFYNLQKFVWNHRYTRVFFSKLFKGVSFAWCFSQNFLKGGHLWFFPKFLTGSLVCFFPKFFKGGRALIFFKNVLKRVLIVFFIYSWISLVFFSKVLNRVFMMLWKISLFMNRIIESDFLMDLKPGELPAKVERRSWLWHCPCGWCPEVDTSERFWKNTFEKTLLLWALLFCHTNYFILSYFLKNTFEYTLLLWSLLLVTLSKTLFVKFYN